MEKMSKQEVELVNEFLINYRDLLHEEVDVPFHPRSLVIVSQPDLDDAGKFDFISYNKWFDETDAECHVGRSQNIIEAFLDVPINVLITAEEVGKSLLSKKDQKKLINALKLISEIRVEKQ